MRDHIEFAAAGTRLLERAAVLLEESHCWRAKVKHLVRVSQDLQRQSQELRAVGKSVSVYLPIDQAVGK
jgi:hypothetical protein